LPLRVGKYMMPSLDTAVVTTTSDPALNCHFKASLEIVDEFIFFE
jgi:hypothetical protein